MHGGGAAARGAGWLERAAAAALVIAAVAGVATAVRMGVAAGGCTDDLIAEVRARTERRVGAEREQIRPILASAAADPDAARRDAEAALGRLEANSQLHLFLAGVYRGRGETAPALREYRRAVELVRDYGDRRSPFSIHSGLAPWLREVRPAASGAALRDLHYLERSLAGGCS